MPATLDRTFLFTDLPVGDLQATAGHAALPDDFGNALNDRWMLDRGIRREDITALDRLAYMSASR